MKFNAFAAVILLPALFFAGCGSAAEVTPEKVEVQGRITLVEGYSAELSFPAGGDEKELVFDTNLPWNSECNARWVSVTPASGDAGKGRSVGIKAEANTETSVRYALVRLKAGAVCLDIMLTQEAAASTPGDDPGTDPQNPDDPGDPDEPDEPGSDPVPAEGDELPCPNPPATGEVDPAGDTGTAGRGKRVRRPGHGHVRCV